MGELNLQKKGFKQPPHTANCLKTLTLVKKSLVFNCQKLKKKKSLKHKIFPKFPTKRPPS